jgi:hypothetical protein
MATVRINDNAIWARSIEDGPDLRARIAGLRPGDVLDLEVAGVVGRWERMRDGRDGRPTLGVKPIAEMRERWKRVLDQRRGEFAPVREVVLADSYLRALTPLLSEWDSAEDEAAYGDL